MASIDKIATKEALKEFSKEVKENFDKLKEAISRINIPIDSSLDEYSSNPVENSVITRKFEEVEGEILDTVNDAVNGISPLLRRDALVIHLLDSSTLTISRYSYYQYKINDGNWQDCTGTISASEGDYVYIKVKSNVTDNSTVGTFSSTGRFEVGGNIEMLRSPSYRNRAVYRCFKSAFANNTTLISAKYLKLPQLTAIVLGSSSESHHSMFYGCTNLIEAPELPSTSIDIRGYESMFQGCTSLTKAPELPAMNLNNYCYQYMFSGCTNLTEAPSILPATTLNNYYYCYNGMFYNCKSLIKSPKICVQGTDNKAQLSGMFNGCSSLRYIECLTTSLSNDFSNWVSGVPSEGIFIKDANTTWTTGNNGIPEGWTVIDYSQGSTKEFTSLGVVNDRIDKLNDSVVTMSEKDVAELLEELGFPVDYRFKYFTIEAVDNTTITFSGISSSTHKYSVDNGVTWTGWPGSVSLNAGDRMLMTCTPNGMSYNSPRITSTGRFKVSGNAFSLLTGDDFWDSSISNFENSFAGLFENNTYLISAKNLVIGNGYYSGSWSRLFYGCTSLVEAPTKLPATLLTLRCYEYMFQGCTSLVEAPELPATTLTNYCYQYMFYGCTSLASVPNLPATTLADYCYQCMFYNCTSLASVPNLPATTLATYCYSSMFTGCTGLISGPSTLPATTLAARCYDGMFYGCTSLTSAPTLPATTLAQGCYNSMFYNCSSLTAAPELHATSIPTSAYAQMFANCTSLVHAPISPTITSVDDRSLESMFSSCSALVDTLPIDTSSTNKNYSFKDMYFNCSIVDARNMTFHSYQGYYSGLGTFHRMFSQCRSLLYPPIFDSNIRVVNSDTFNSMFKNCNALLNVIPGSYVSGDFDRTITAFTEMYRSCTSLTDASGITIVGTTNAGEWASMFRGCTSLVTAPTLDFASQASSGWWPTDKGVCNYMFNGCSALNYIKCLLPKYLSTNMSSGNFSSWVSGVAATGTFVRYDANADFWSTGASGIPSGWTVQNNA